VNLRSRLHRIEQAARGSYITLHMPDGRVLRFTEQDQIDAYRSMCERARALYRLEEIPPPHPLEQAAKDAVYHEGPLASFVDVDADAPGYRARRGEQGGPRD
jgi:hypothetical protein